MEKFTCTCNGCRRMPRDYARSHVESVLSELNGHYFGADTRRFFRVRLQGFTYERVSGTCGAVIVFSTKAGDMGNTWRESDAAVFCRYGNLVESWQGKDARNLRKDASPAFEYAVRACMCHGCQIDRA